MNRSGSRKSHLARLQAFADMASAIGVRAAFRFMHISRRFRDGCSSSLEIRPKQLVHPIFIRPNSSDIDVFCQIFLEQEYACLDALEEVGQIIDCGANVGYSSAYFLSRFPDSVVYAVEADQDNYQTACRNLLPYAERVKVVHAGIWSHKTRLDLRTESYRDGRQSSRQVQEGTDHSPTSIEGIDIGSIVDALGSPRISLLKIDIEGAESAVFGSHGNSSRWLPSVDAIAIELHDDSVFGECSSVFMSAISGQNFSISSSGELTICIRE